MKSHPVVETLLCTEHGRENPSDLNRPCGVFRLHAYIGSVYNSVRGRRRSVRTLDSDRGTEIGRLAPNLPPESCGLRTR